MTVPLSDILLDTQPNNFSGAVGYSGTLTNIRDIGRRNVNASAGLTFTNLSSLTNLRNATIIFDNSSIFAPTFSLHNGGNLYADTAHWCIKQQRGGNIIGIGIVTVFLAPVPSSPAATT